MVSFLPLLRAAVGITRLVAMLAAVHACSSPEDPAGSTSEPSTAAAATVSGSVQMKARLYDGLRAVIGERVVADADGVAVRLVRPDGTTEAAVTQGGRFSFPAGAAGTYRATSGFVPGSEATADVALAAGASGELPTLVLGPSGDVHTYPNPFAATGLSIEFEAALDQPFDVVAHGLSGAAVWNQSGKAVQGLNHIHWMGTDRNRAPVPAGPYWIVVHVDDARHSNLVFKP